MSHEPTVAEWPEPPQDAYATLRGHGARAHQLRTSLQAAVHYLARGREAGPHDNRATALWLVTCGLNLAAELSTGMHRLNKRLRENDLHRELQPAVSRMRRHACQVHAAARATAHFLTQEGRNDHEVGNWLIVTARNLAQDLAVDIDGHSNGPHSVQ